MDLTRSFPFRFTISIAALYLPLIIFFVFAFIDSKNAHAEDDYLYLSQQNIINNYEYNYVDDSNFIQSQEELVVDDKVTVQLLNKITARVSKIEISKGETKAFGNLAIKLIACWKSPPTEKPENAALIKISEFKPSHFQQENFLVTNLSEDELQKLFLGWMFSSSPALSSLEHPVYDLTVIKCDIEESI